MRAIPEPDNEPPQLTFRVVASRFVCRKRILSAKEHPRTLSLNLLAQYNLPSLRLPWRLQVPAVQRLAIPEASPTLPLAVSLGLTFSYNVTVGIPVYTVVAIQAMAMFPVS